MNSKGWLDAKYVDGKAVTIDVPAKLPNDVSDKIRSLLVRAYQAHREDTPSWICFSHLPEIFMSTRSTPFQCSPDRSMPLRGKNRGFRFRI